MAVSNIFQLMRILCVFVLLTVSASISQAGTGMLSPNVGKWDVFEINLTTTNTYSNPYLDVWLNATFNGPNNTKINIDGFWNGGYTWILRMAPPETGTWSYITSSNDPKLNGIVGSFNAVESGNKGFIRINPNYPYSFIYADGSPFFWMGDTLWDDPGIIRFQEYIDSISSYGYNNYHTIIIHDRYEYQNNEGGVPFKMINKTRRNYDKLSPSFFQALDKRVIYANSKGIAPQMYFTWSQEFTKFTRQQFERFAKYMVARYAAYNVIWVISGEYNEESIPSEYIYHGNIVYNKDPYKHPISLHPAGAKNFVSPDEPWLTYVMQQRGAAPEEDVYIFIMNDRKYNKPVVNGEAHYLTNRQIDINSPINLDEWRRQNWKIVIAGGFFDTGYQNIFYDPNNMYGTGGWNLNLSDNLIGMAQMKHLRAFFNRVEYWKMNPDEMLVSNGYALVNAGNEYVIYLPAGGSTTANLSAANGTLSTEWYNPRSGNYQGQTTVQGGAPRRFTAPDSNDWVLHIKAVGGATRAIPLSQYLLERLHLLLNTLKRFVYL